MLLNAINRIWRLLIFRDHWQGEFCIAAFGAMGWAMLSFVEPSLGQPQYAILQRMFSENVWAAWFFVSGVAQITGLGTGKPWLRLIGATGVFIGLVCVFLSLAITVPWTKGISVYFAAMMIEACAMIFQTATIVRYGSWISWTLRR